MPDPSESDPPEAGPSARARRPRGRPRKFVEADVLDTIMHLFWDRGFADTSLDMISEATHVGRPSLYATFGDKEQMYLAALQNYQAQMRAEIERVITKKTAAAGATQDVLTAAFNTLIDLFTQNGTRARGCLILMTTTQTFEGTQVPEELQHLLARLDGLFLPILEYGKSRGEVSGDTRALASMLGGLSHTLAVRARAGRSRRELRKLAAATITQLVRS